jgi:hypothetical protein
VKRGSHSPRWAAVPEKQKGKVVVVANGDNRVSGRERKITDEKHKKCYDSGILDRI